MFSNLRNECFRGLVSSDEFTLTGDPHDSSRATRPSGLQSEQSIGELFRSKEKQGCRSASIGQLIHRARGENGCRTKQTGPGRDEAGERRNPGAPHSGQPPSERRPPKGFWAHGASLYRRPAGDLISAPVSRLARRQSRQPAAGYLGRGERIAPQRSRNGAETSPQLVPDRAHSEHGGAFKSVDRRRRTS